MLIRIIDVSQEGRTQDAQGEEEAEGKTEEDRGEDGVGYDHGVHIPASALLLEHSIRRIVLEDGSLNSGRNGENHGEEDDTNGDSDIDLSLPLEFRSDSSELEGDVAREGHKTERSKQIVEGEVKRVEPGCYSVFINDNYFK